MLVQPRLFLATVVSLFLSAGTPQLFAQVVSLPSIRDNTLYEDPAGLLSSGAGTGLFVGRVGATGGAEIRRGLLKFDPVGVIPPGSIITGATLRLFMNKTMAGDKSVAVHRTLADWGEGTSAGEGAGSPSTSGDATWIHRFYSAAFWSAPGGDYSPTAIASKTVGQPGFYEWSSTALIADVQAWLDDPASNFGWSLLGDEASPQTAKRFCSREWFFPNERPALIVAFEPPTPCYPDCDGNTALTIDDFICFQTRFATGHASSDCDANGNLNINDFVCFLTLFALGC
jgi:hypothetical protein